MDAFESSSKKHALDDLSKEELIGKYKALLTLAQKAKQAKDILIKENAELKTSLDVPEQSGCELQVRILTDENKKLISDLSVLEAQIEELKRIGLIQQEQLLALEKLKPPDAEDVSDLRGTNEKLKEKLKLYHSKVIKFAQDVKHLKQARQDLLAMFNSYVSQVSRWKTQLEALRRFIQHNEEETQEVKTQNANVSSENSKLRGCLEALALNFEGSEDSLRQKHEHQDLHAILDERIKKLLSRNSRLESEVAEFSSQKLEEIKELGAVLASLIDACAHVDSQFMSRCEALKTEHNIELEYAEVTSSDGNGGDVRGLACILEAKIKRQMRLADDALSAVNEIQLQKAKLAEAHEEELRRVRGENAELLEEMNEMNEVLKERGETISKQQTFCDKLIDTLNQKEELIKTLQREANHKTETTPISEDALREKDEVIGELRSELEELRGKLLMSTSDEGCCMAESETMSISTVSRTEDLARMKDLESSWEERYGKLRNLALKLKRKTTELTAELSREQAEKAELQQKLNKTIGTFQQQMDWLQDELEASKSDGRTYLKRIESAGADSARDKRSLASNEELISKLRGELENLSREKSEMENWKKQVGSKVQTLKNELKANALLKKEFEGKTGKLSADLEAKEKTLKHEAEKHAQTRASLQESIDECKRLSLLTLELRDYENVAKDISHDLDKKQETITSLKNQVDSYKTNLNELQAQKKQLEDDAKLLEANVARVKGENDLHVGKISELEKHLLERELRLQSLSHALEDSKLENEDLTRQLSDAMVEHEKLIGSLRGKEEQLKSAHLGLEQKLRALQETLKLKGDELSEVRGDYESYKIRARSLMQQSRDFGTEEKLTGEVSRLRGQVETLKEEVKELRATAEKRKEENEVLASRNCQLLKQSETVRSEIDDDKRQHERLLLEHQLSVTEHAETVRSLKLHTEKLTDYYQRQLSDQEARHNIEIRELQSNVSKALSPSKAPSLAPPSMMVREEGEGSENVDGNSTNNNNSNSSNPLPLEKLLSGESDKDATSIRKQLSENEVKVSHLTALLADAEQDLAKHVQMNKVLKEEIRRQQRCVEREKHAENMEYLKNVVFKFLTLGNGDERTRLVPVLNTILKLSPDEHRKLLMVSKGDGKSWASYLPGGWGS